jgi:hypothetical protein
MTSYVLPVPILLVDLAHSSAEVVGAKARTSGRLLWTNSERWKTPVVTLAFAVAARRPTLAVMDCQDA